MLLCSCAPTPIAGTLRWVPPPLLVSTLVSVRLTRLCRLCTDAEPAVGPVPFKLSASPAAAAVPISASAFGRQCRYVKYKVARADSSV